MTPLQAQFDLLKDIYPSATLTVLPSGAGLIAIPNMPLPPGWSRTTTTVRFVAPVGYPFAKPDCFWVDADLRLQNGSLPQAANIQPIPETQEPLVWFSWHTSQWHPSRDNLLTYVNVIKGRLREVR